MFRKESLKQRQQIVKSGDTFFKGFVNSGDTVAGGIQNSLFGGVKKSRRTKKGYEPYKTMKERESSKKKKK